MALKTLCISPVVLRRPYVDFLDVVSFSKTSSLMGTVSMELRNII